jgi:hypothetical protein
VNVIEQVGEGGKGCCSRFGCTNRAVVKRKTLVAHPYQSLRQIVSWHCPNHTVRPDPNDYPNYEIVSEEPLN